jgi:sterol desaturase/sphingolipid hydroxylase (fatty acid hydroxylase superfamily)
MTEIEFQILRAGGFVTAIGFALGMQRLRPHARLRGNAPTNVGFWLVNLVVIAAVCGACACTAANWAAAGGIGLFNVAAAPAWLAVPATIAALDMVSYGWHRANHQIPFLWRFHQVHHSDSDFTVSTAARFHPGELVMSLPFRLAAVVLLGATPESVIAFEVLFGIANFFEHGDIDLPLKLERRLRSVFVLPALHRRHHSRHGSELNSNFATIFIVWDRLFGTYGDATSEARVEIGLPGGREEQCRNLRDALLAPATVSSRPA